MSAPLPLANRLDLPAARPLAEAISARSGEDLEIDASTVAHLGGLCLQVLLAAAASWRSAGRRLTLAHRSAAFDEALALFAIAPALLESQPEPEAAA